LDATGLAQATAAAAQLAQLPPTAIVSSDLGRARVTAGRLAAITGLPVAVDERLRETFAGQWQGLAREDLLARHGDELAQWAGGSDLRPGGGERRSEVAARMVGGIEDALAGMPSGGTLVVVTHGGAARAAVGQLLGLPVAHWAILGVLTNCAWSVLTERTDAAGAVTWRLEEYNARSLPEAAAADDR
jgi:glucosyl-3-phosphoglycerate phosphatase